MRRRTARKLANLGRLAGASACALGAAIAVVWHQSPKAIAAIESRLHRALTAPVQRRHEAARGERNPDRQEKLLRSLLDDLAGVQRQDHLASTVKDCQLRLADLAERRGDLAGATAWLRECVTCDDHDVRTMARLGDLLCRQPATQREGFEVLFALDARFPANPNVSPVLVRSLLAAGRTGAAIDALAAAAAEPQSNYWYVFWDTGRDFEVHHARMVPSSQTESLRLRFDLVDKCSRLRFILPRFSSMTLTEPSVTVVAGGHAHTIDLLGPAARMHQVERSADRIEAIGHYDARIDVDLPDLPAGPWEVTLSATRKARLSTLLAAPTVTPAMGALRDELAARGDAAGLRLLQSWRNVALTGQRMDCYFREASSSFDGKRRIGAALESPGDDTIAVHFPIGKPAAVLRVDLPAGARGVEYRWRKLTVVVDGEERAFDPATMPLLGTYELTREGGIFVATGDDPYFWFAAPPGRQIDAVLLEGTL
jgi:hypothetical protein